MPNMLTFPWDEVNQAVTELRAATKFRTLYGAETGPGFWLVADEGVYLMPNLQIDKPLVVYADECDPSKLPFDRWWATKRATFGADDGVEFIPLADIEQQVATFSGTPRVLDIEFTKARFSVGLL